MEETTMYRVRKLTPKECWRLMAFTDEDFYRAKKVSSNSALYKAAGNAIVTTCLMALFSQLHITGIKPWNEMTDEEREELVSRTRKNFAQSVLYDEQDDDENTDNADSELDEDDNDEETEPM